MKSVESCQIAGLDDFYEKYLPQKGHFVEVGAFDGIISSNTYHLACNGWSGVYIEPIKDYYLKCINIHKENNVQILNLACSDHTGTLQLYHDGGHLWTAEKQFVNCMGTTTVRCTTLDNILSLYNEKIDLLVIDAEFHEVAVLDGFSINKHKPTMVIIEAHEGWAEKRLEYRLRYYEIYFAGYKKIYSDNVNNIYVL